MRKRWQIEEIIYRKQEKENAWPKLILKFKIEK